MVHTSPEDAPLFREAVRLRALGLTRQDIADRLQVHRRTVTRWLEHPVGKERLAALQDALDAELVRSAIYNPWVELLAQPRATRKRQRRHFLTD